VRTDIQREETIEWTVGPDAERRHIDPILHDGERQGAASVRWTTHLAAPQGVPVASLSLEAS
jgi:hypothetical protein